MEKRFQETLDAHADALSARDARVHQIRLQFGKLLKSLADQKQTELESTEDELEKVKAYNAKIDQTLKRQELAQEELNKIDESEEALSLKTLASDIEEGEEMILTMQAKVAKLREKLVETENSVASKKARFQEYLKELKPKEKKDTTTLDTQKTEIEREIEAATSGEELWAQACSILRDLDTQIEKLGPEVSQGHLAALENASRALDATIQCAKHNNWTPLIIAIGHEMEMIKATTEIVKDTLAS